MSTRKSTHETCVNRNSKQKEGSFMEHFLIYSPQSVLHWPQLTCHMKVTYIQIDRIMAFVGKSFKTLQSLWKLDLKYTTTIFRLDYLWTISEIKRVAHDKHDINNSNSKLQDVRSHYWLFDINIQCTMNKPRGHCTAVFWSLGLICSAYPPDPNWDAKLVRTIVSRMS